MDNAPKIRRACMGHELPADVTVILMTMVDPRSSGRPNEADATSNSNLDSISVSFSILNSRIGMFQLAI